MHFVQDDQPIQAFGQVQLGGCELGAVQFGLQVQINVVGLAGEFERYRGFARLSRAQQGDCGIVGQILAQAGQDFSLKNPCILCIMMMKMQ